MTEYNILKCNVVKFATQLNLGIKSSTEVTLNLSSNIISDSNNEANFAHKMLLTDTQVSTVCRAFWNNSSANIRLSKAQLNKVVQLGGFIGPLSGFWLLLNPDEGTKKIIKQRGKRKQYSFCCKSSVCK